MKFTLVLIVVSQRSVFVWWLNEGRASGDLERKRRELAALMGEEGGAK